MSGTDYGIQQMFFQRKKVTTLTAVF